MSKCKTEGCLRRAIFLSDFCWVHEQDKKGYVSVVRTLSRKGKLTLREENLEEVDLCRANLWDVDLSKAVLARANLEGADLWRAVMDGADLKHTNLEGANLWGASLVSADLEASVLRRAVLRGADLRGADLRCADLSSAAPPLTFRSLADPCLGPFWWPKPSFLETDLRGANLDRADLRGADLTNVDLRGARLHNADLREAVLTGAMIWSLSCAGCRAEGARIEYLNCDENGSESGIIRLDHEEAERLFT